MRRTILSAALGLLPSLLHAQGTISIGGAGTPASLGPNGLQMFRMISKRDVDRFDPVGLLISKRKDLKLDETQVKQADAARKTAKAGADALFKRLDSSQFATRALVNASRSRSSPADEKRIAEGMEQQARLLDEIRELQLTTAGTVVGTFREDQRPRASQLLDKARADLATEDAQMAMPMTVKVPITIRRGGG